MITKWIHDYIVVMVYDNQYFLDIFTCLEFLDIFTCLE
jgi:hypothetical protein